MSLYSGWPFDGPRACPLTISRCHGRVCHASPCCLMALGAWPRPGLSQVKLAQPLKLWNKPVCTSVTRTSSAKKPCHDDDLCLPVDHQQGCHGRVFHASPCCLMALAAWPWPVLS